MSSNIEFLHPLRNALSDNSLVVIANKAFVDASARKFVLNDPRITDTDIQSLLLRGRIFGGELLGNVNVERLIVSRSSSRVQPQQFDLKSTNLSFEALDDLFLSESISIVSEDALSKSVESHSTQFSE
jgi:hypothetical protein